MYSIIPKREMRHNYHCQQSVEADSFYSYFASSSANQKAHESKNIQLWLFAVTCEGLPSLTFCLVQHLLRLPFTLSSVFSFSYLTLLIRISYPQTYISWKAYEII